MRVNANEGDKPCEGESGLSAEFETDFDQLFLVDNTQVLGLPSPR